MADQDMPSTSASTRVADTNTDHGAASRSGTTGATGGQSSTGGTNGRSLRQQADDAARDARDKAASLTAESSHAAREEANRAAAKARELADQVAAQAAGIADQAVSRVRETADEAIREQRDRATGFVHSVERAVDAAARSLQEDGYGPIASYVRYAASTLQSVNEEVEGFEPQRLTGRAERAVRRNPLLTYGALAVAGFALVSLMNAQQRR